MNHCQTRKDVIKMERNERSKMRHNSARAVGESFGGVLRRRRSIYQGVSVIGRWLGFGIMGYLMASLLLPFNTNPLGVAVLASVSSAIPAVLLGAIYGAVSSGGGTVVYICTYGALVLMRLFLRIMSDDIAEGDEREELVDKKGLFCDRLFSRMIVCLIISFVIGIYRLIEGGFRYYDLVGAFFYVICALFATAVISLCFDEHILDTAFKESDKQSIVDLT